MSCAFTLSGTSFQFCQKQLEGFSFLSSRIVPASSVSRSLFQFLTLIHALTHEPNPAEASLALFERLF